LTSARQMSVPVDCDPAKEPYGDHGHRGWRSGTRPAQEQNRDVNPDPIAAAASSDSLLCSGRRHGTDVRTGKRHRDVCLVPLAWFKDHVPVRTAQRQGRLRGLRSISHMPQLHGPSGQVGGTLSAINWEDVPEVCEVCNLHPDVFTEPTSTVAADLR
jgi:hypothetical protein